MEIQINKTKKWIINMKKIKKIKNNRFIQETDNYHKIQNLKIKTIKYLHFKNRIYYS